MRSTLLLLLLCAGCSSVEQQSWTPLRPRAPITTEGGAQLEADPDGRILWRPSQDDLDAAIGAALETDPDGGVRVVGLLSAEGPLEVDDVIRAVRARPSPRPVTGGPLHPLHPAAVTSGAFSYSTWPTGAGRRPPPAPAPRMAPPVIAEIRAEGHPVRGLDDLRGYALCPCLLDLVVLRAGQELALRAELAAGRPIEAPSWAPAGTRTLGFEAVRIGDLPRALRPNQVIGSDDDLLVTFVGEGSTIALRGLRPLDVIPHGARELAEDPNRVLPVCRARERGSRDVDFTPASTSEEWSVLPFFQASRTTPTHFKASSSLFLVDLLDLHERWDYEPRTDRYERDLELHVGAPLLMPLLFRCEVHDGDGRADETSVGFFLFDLQLQAEAE